MQTAKHKNNVFGKSQHEEAWISDLDPMMESSFRVVFQQNNFLLQVRKFGQNGKTVSTKELMNLRILIKQIEQDKASELKVELSSQEDIFQVYICHIDDKIFQKIKKGQQLNYSFSNFPSMLVKQIDLCQKNLNEYSAVLFLNKITSHKLVLLENIQYKRIQLLSLEFNQLDEETIRNYVTFKFTKVKMNSQIVQKKIRDVFSMVKIKNPNLLADFDRKDKLKQDSNKK